MNNSTLKALEGSIIKWNNICMGDTKDLGSSNYPLCTLFFYASNCEGCPVFERTRYVECGDTPYCYWSVSELTISGFETLSGYKERYQVDNLSWSNLIQAAEEELIFLCTLLPEDHKWRCLI